MTASFLQSEKWMEFQRSLGRKVFDIDKIKSIKRLLGKPVIDRKDYDGVKLICDDESWLMFRPSGTEPLVRVYAEARSLSKAKKILA